MHFFRLVYQSVLTTPNSKLLRIYRYKSNFKSSFLSKLFNYVVQQGTPCITSNRKSVQNETNVLNDMFHKLDKQMRLHPERITSNSFYKETVASVPHLLNGEIIYKDDLIKILFYVGLLKKSPFARSLVHSIILRLKDCLQDLTLEDTCIIANAAYKTNLNNIDSSIVQHIQLVINKNFDQIVEDQAILICLIKTLRITQLNDYDLLLRLSSCQEKWTQYITTSAHIAALFAEAKYFDEVLIKSLVSSIMACLQDTSSLQYSAATTFEKRPRAKDVARFLWALSSLGWTLSKQEVEQIIWPQLHCRLDNEYRKQPEVLIDSLCSLCLMGYYSKELSNWVFSSDVHNLIADSNKIQPWVRLQLLLTATHIERPCLLQDVVYTGPAIPAPTIKAHLEQRPALQRVLEAIQCLAPSLNLAPPKCQFQVSPLHIAGLVVSSEGGRRQAIHLEVADPSVCLHESSLLTGFMKLKLRLLKSKHKHVILLNQTQLNKDDEDLYVWLEDELHKHFK